MRRGSLFAPLLLIGLGALFLARNLYPDLRLLDYLSKYWPFVLILWGVLRLVEILFWSASDRPLPARGVSAGEWVLVVFLCLFGASLHAALGFSGFPGRIELGGLDLFGESYDYPLAGEKPASKTAHVVIESFRGNARITGTDADTVKVTGRQSIRSLDQEGADRAGKQAVLEIAGDASRIVIRTNQERALRPRRITAELEIAVPKGASIEAHGTSGDFDITGIAGTVDIASDNAGVRMEDVGGDAHLELRRSDIVRAVNLKGALDLKGSGSDIDLENVQGAVTINGGYTGNVQFQNVGKPLHFVGPQTEFYAEKIPGLVRMPLGNFNASNLTGPVRLTTGSRDIQISGVTNSLDVSVNRGDIELRPESQPLAKMNVRVRSGDITLALPANAKFDLTASTNRGEIQNDFGDALKVQESGRGAALHGSGGGPALDLHTDFGAITVRTASANEPPLAPRSEGPGRFKGFKGPQRLKGFKQPKVVEQ